MYQRQTYVMHKTEGVCLIEDIRTECFSKDGEREYYILRPIYGSTSTTVFLPVSSGDSRLRPLLTESELQQALSVAGEEMLWENNDRFRQETFHRLIREADTHTLYRLMRELYERRRQQAAQGKRLRFFDEQVLQDAERLLAQETAHVLEVSIDEAKQYIRKTGE